MNLSIGIVGLPNVGKSTLFNALTQNEVPAENYPFCTIDPNVGIVPVIDPRLDQLAELVRPAKVTPAVVEFWDIAGLVKGAASGAGLGNQFLGNIRNVQAIVHVVRAFQNSNITHVEDYVDPARDIELINTELILKDLETVDSRLKATEGKARVDKSLQPVADMVKALREHLDSGKLANQFSTTGFEKEQLAELNSLFLLTAKPVIYVFNTDKPESITQLMSQYPNALAIDIKLEAEIAVLPKDEQAEYLQGLGLAEPALARLTREAYKILGLISFFTAGEQEVRAWTISQGDKAPQAAGVIHTDFEKHFIKADVVPFHDFIAAGGPPGDQAGWLGAREQGKVKLAGKDYIVQDGDVMLIKHGA